jgi:DNA-binding SARP family transcriptional activator
MKIRQELIDKLASSDYTREELVRQLLEARYYSGKYKAEANWLDQLADMLRDEEGNEGQDRIYKEYQDDITDNMDKYRDRTNES